MSESYNSIDGDFISIPATTSSVGTPWTLVSERFDRTAQFADDAFSYTENYINNIEALMLELHEYSVPDIEVTLPAIAALGIKERPFSSDLELSIDDWPVNMTVKPELDVLPTITSVDIPDFNILPPAYTNYAAPEETEVAVPEKPVLNSNIVAPAVPDYLLPNVPTLDELFLPEKPSVDIPLFEHSLSIADIPDPTAFVWNESAYNTDVWESLLDRALDGIINGGGVLSAEVEQLIYDRALERERIATDKAFQQSEDYFSARGYELPPGAMASRLQEITTERLQAETNLNSEIAIDQAKRADENSRFFLQLGQQMDGVLRDFHNTQEQRTLEAARTAASASIDVMNGYINKQNSYNEVYKTHAAVYSERIRGALAHIELYKAEIQGVLAESEVQKSQVAIYEAQIGAVRTAADLYKTQLEGVKIQQEMDALKIEIFKAETDVYNAQLQGERVKADIYKTKVDSEMSKAETYKTQIQAYVAEVEARKTELQVQVVELEAKSSKNRLELDRYRAELDAYNIEVQAKSGQIDAIARGYEAEVTAYNGENQMYASYYQTKAREIDMNIHEARFNLEKAVAEIESSTKSYLAIKELELKGTEGVMQVAAQLAASALSAVHASANYGYSGQESHNHSFGYNTSLTENHSVPHEPPG